MLYTSSWWQSAFFSNRPWACSAFYSSYPSFSYSLSYWRDVLRCKMMWKPKSLAWIDKKLEKISSHRTTPLPPRRWPSFTILSCPIRPQCEIQTFMSEETVLWKEGWCWCIVQGATTHANASSQQVDEAAKVFPHFCWLTDARSMYLVVLWLLHGVSIVTGLEGWFLLSRIRWQGSFAW